MKVTECDNNFAITTRDLSLSLNKASSTARTFGVSLDELLGYTTAIGSATRESGNIVGNSLKTIMSRITTNSNAIGALNDIGISINDMEGNVRPVADIIEELAGKWGSLSSAQQQNTAVNVAGIYQLSRFNALMINHKMGQDATAASMNSFNSAASEQIKYNESLEARINRLSNATYKLANSVGESVLYDSIVVITEGLNKLADTSSGAISNIGAFAPLFGIIGVAAYTLSGNLRTLVTSTYATAAANVAATGSTGLLARGMTMLSASTALASTALKSLGFALGIGAVFAALGFAIEKVTGAMSDMIQEQEAIDNYNKQNIEAMTLNKESTEELIESYLSLSRAKENSSNWDSEKEKEYLEIQQRLSEVFPALIDKIDSTGQAHLKNEELIKKELEATEKLIDAQNRLSLANATQEFKKLKTEIDGGAFGSTKNFIYGDLEEQIKNTKIAIEGLSKRGLDTSEQEVKLINLQQQYQTASEQIKEKIYTIIDAISALNDTEINNNLSSNIKSFVSGLDLSDLNESELNAFSNAIGNFQVKLQQAMDTKDVGLFKSTIDDINSLASVSKNFEVDINGLALTYEGLIEAINSGNGFIDASADELNAMSETVNKADDAIKTLTDSISNINGILEDYAESNQLSASTIMELIEEYPQLLAYVNDEARLIEELTKIRDQDISAAQKQLAEKIDMSEDYYNANLKMIESYFKEHFKFYEGDLSQFQNLAQAKADVERSLIEHLAKEWSSYYDTISGNFIPLMGATVDSNQPHHLPDGDMSNYPNLGEYNKKANEANRALQNMKKGLDNFTLGQINLDFSTLGTSLDKNTKSAKKADKATKESNKTAKESKYVTDEYKQAIDALNLAIEKLQKLQAKFPKHSAEYRKALQDEIKLQKEKLDLMNSQASAVDKQIKSGKIAQTGIVEVSPATTTKTTTASKKLNGWSGSTTSAFGMRMHPTLGVMKMHEGIDIDGKKGDRLDANVNGKVVSQGYSSESGNFVKIQDSNGFKHFYAHLDKAFVKLGDIVEAGTHIGNIGSTGRTTGSHLHYGVQDKNGKYINPIEYAKSAKNNKVVTSTTSSNEKSASTIKAEVEQSIDQAKSELIGIYSDIENQKELIAQLELATIDSYLASFENRRADIDRQLAHEDAKIKNLDKSSERYAKTIEYQATILKRKQSANKEELKYIEDLISKGGLSAITLDEMNNRTKELATEIYNLDQQTQGLVFDKLDIFTEKRELPTDDIEMLRAKMELLDDDTLEFSDALNEVISELREIQSINQEELIDLEKAINSGEYTGEVLAELKDRYQALQVTIQNTNAEIRETFYQASQVKFNINNKSIKKTQDEIDFLNYKLSLLDEKDVTTKVTVMFEIQNSLSTSIAKMNDAIKDSIIMRNDAIAMGLNTDLFDNEIESLIGQRRNQLSEMQSTYNQMQGIVTDAKSKIKEAEDNAYSEASKAIDETIKQTEKSLKYFTDVIKDFDDKMNLLQESDYDQHITITSEQVSQTKQLASQIVSEYHRIASTPVYNEEQKEKVEGQLSSLKDQLSGANSEIINYTKELEKVKFNKLLSGTRKSQKEISRLNSILEGNLAILEGGRLKGTDINLDFGTSQGNVLDLSTLISNPADSLKNQELTIQDIRSSSYGAQIAEAESFHAQMQAQAEQFQSVMIDSVEKFEKMVLTLTEIADKEKQKEKEEADKKLLKQIEDASKDEAETLKTHYSNIKENMLNSMGEYKDDFGGIWDDIIADLDTKLSMIEDRLANIASGADIEVPTTPSSGGSGNSSAPSTGGGSSSGNGGNSGGGNSNSNPSKPSTGKVVWTEIYDRVRGIKKVFYSDGSMEQSGASKNKDVGAKTIVEERIDRRTGIKTQTMKDGTTKDFPNIGKDFVNAYAKGTDGAQKGLSLVGEEGSELVVQKDGTAYLTGDSHELRNLNSGDKVFTAEQTKRMLTDNKNPIPAFANGYDNQLLPTIYNPNTVKMIDFNGKEYLVEFEQIANKFNEGLRFLVNGVASTDIVLKEHTTGFEKVFDGLKDYSIGQKLSSGEYRLTDSKDVISTDNVKKIIKLEDILSNIISTNYSYSNKDYIDLNSNSSAELIEKLQERHKFSYNGLGLDNPLEEVRKYINYYRTGEGVKPEFYTQEIVQSVGKIVNEANESKQKDYFKVFAGDALESLVTTGSTSLVELFKVNNPEVDSILNKKSIDELKSEYSGNYDAFSKLLTSGEVYNDNFIRTYDQFNKNMSNLLSSAYDYFNIYYSDPNDKNRDTKLANAKSNYGYSYTSLNDNLPNGMVFEDIVKSFGFSATDDIFKIGQEVSKPLFEKIKSIKAPTKSDQVLLYANGVPHFWTSEAEVQSILSFDSRTYSRGNENAAMFMQPTETTPPSGDNSVGTTPPQYNALDGIDTTVNYTEKFKKQAEEYKKAREPRLQKIADLQAKLDKAEESNNKAEEARLTKLLLDETSQLDRADYQFNYDKSIDLANQTKLVAKNAIIELERKKEDETLTEEMITAINDTIAEMHSINIEADSKIKDAVAKALASQNNYWNIAHSQFTDKIDDLEYERDMLDEDDKSGRLRLENEIIEQQKLYIQGLASQKAELQDLLKTQEVGTHEWNQTNGALKEVNETIEDANLSLKGMKKEVENSANDIISVVKKGLEKQRDLEVAELEKRLDKLNDVYKSKMDAIGDRESERDFNRDKQDRETEIKDLEKQLNILSLDDSQEAIAKRLNLQKQLKEKREELVELEYKRGVELERKAIEDSQKLQEEAISKEIEDTKWKYDEMIANEQMFSKIRQDILNGNLAYSSNLLTGFLDSFTEYNKMTTKELGQSFQGLLNLIDEVADAYNNLYDINGNKPDANGVIHGGGIIINRPISGTPAKAPSAPRIDPPKPDYKFENGGITSSTGMHWLDGTLAKPEIVLNSSDTSNLLDIIKMTRDLIPKLPKIKLPNISNLLNPQSANTSEYNLTLNIDNLNGTQKDANNMATTIMQSLKKMGH